MASLHITCMSEGMKINRLWTVLAQKTDSEIQWGNSFYCDNYFVWPVPLLPVHPFTDEC